MDVVESVVGLTGAPGVFVVDIGGQRLFEPQARSVGQQPPPREAGHDLNPVEQTEAVVTEVPIDLEVELVCVRELFDDDEERDDGGDEDVGPDGLPGITTVVVEVVMIGGKFELEVAEGGGRDDTVGCTVTVAVDAKTPKTFFSADFATKSKLSYVQPMASHW